MSCLVRDTTFGHHYGPKLRLLCCAKLDCDLVCVKANDHECRRDNVDALSPCATQIEKWPRLVVKSVAVISMHKYAPLSIWWWTPYLAKKNVSTRNCRDTCASPFGQSIRAYSA